jgi:hypothetical protein
MVEFLIAEFVRLLGGRTSGEPNPSRPADLPTSRFADKFGSAGVSPS